MEHVFKAAELAATSPYGIAALSLVTISVSGITAYKVIGWGSTVTTLLGNHLRHDLGDVKEEIRGLKKVGEHNNELLTRQLELLEKLVGNSNAGTTF